MHGNCLIMLASMAVLLSILPASFARPASLLAPIVPSPSSDIYTETCSYAPAEATSTEATARCGPPTPSETVVSGVDDICCHCCLHNWEPEECAAIQCLWCPAECLPGNPLAHE